jgi:hypothetical protein
MSFHIALPPVQFKDLLLAMVEIAKSNFLLYLVARTLIFKVL